MGLLDDAIREHLELKRQHGAAADEVQRQEHEALGPIRRRGDPEPAEEPLATPEDPHEPVTTGADPSYAEPVDAAIPLDQPVMPEPAGHEPALEEFAPGEQPAAAPIDDVRPAVAPIDDVGPAAVPVREPEPEPEPVEHDRGFAGDDLWLDDSEEQAPPDDRSAPPGQETSAFSAADVADATGQPAAPDEDVLEETPEFLQETPEHERLWFEQRPPRGFDFDQ